MPSEYPQGSSKKAQRISETTQRADDIADLQFSPDFGTRIEPFPDEDTTSTVMVLENEKPSLMVLLLTFLASISGFMFGYDTGYISSALVSIGDSFGQTLSYGNEQYITAATSLGALITAVISGLIVDYFGRKPVLMVSNILFVVGSVIQCASNDVWTMIIGRLIMGFGVGTGSILLLNRITSTSRLTTCILIWRLDLIRSVS